MKFNSMSDIISFAIEREKEAAEFYTELSRQEKFSGAKKSLKEFAEQERKHQKLLEGFSADKAKLDGYTFKWIVDLKRSDYTVDIAYEPGMPYNDILRIAMKREEKSLKLYNELIEKANNKDITKLFKVLCQEEAKHKNILETMYDDYMAKQGD